MPREAGFNPRELQQSSVSLDVLQCIAASIDVALNALDEHMLKQTFQV